MANQPSELIEPIKFLFEATKVMIPVITGFIVFFGGSITRLWDPQRTDRSALIHWSSARAAVILAVLALGLWTGVMAFSIRASLGSSTEMHLIPPFDASLNFRLGRYCAAAGNISFFAAVAFACLSYWRTGPATAWSRPRTATHGRETESKANEE